MEAETGHRRTASEEAKDSRNADSHAAATIGGRSDKTRRQEDLKGERNTFVRISGLGLSRGLRLPRFGFTMLWRAKDEEIRSFVLRLIIVTTVMI